MVDLQLTHDALLSSTLNHGLKVMGDRWTGRAAGRFHRREEV
jgi:hypothetical protein